MGSPWAFAGACTIVLVWGAVGPLFDFSESWQLFINSGTTIATFLMVFLIQNSQNRDTFEIKTMLREMVKDIPEVDDRKIAETIEDEARL